MQIRKYRVKARCLSCNNAVKGNVTVVITHVPEDRGAERAFIVHESCQNALIASAPYLNEANYGS